LPPAWTLMVIGLAVFGVFTYRRKNSVALTAT
jgi:hypothetical protein